MADEPVRFETFNAKKMSAIEVANSFVVPSYFYSLASKDHCYIIGPRGSGKTTLLRMLQGETLTGWTGSRAERARQGIDYSSIFLPADELWASQTNSSTANAAFAAQMLYAFVETMIYRSSKVDKYGNEVHLPVHLTYAQEGDVSNQCAEAWGLQGASPGFMGLLKALDMYLAWVSTGRTDGRTALEKADAMALLAFGVRAFNRVVDQPDHQWALLLDEMELAPADIHREVVSFVRGGASNLILKISMSPFDRYMHQFGVGSGPIPGHDFQTIYLSDPSLRERRTITNGLWNEGLRARGFPHVQLVDALGTADKPLNDFRSAYRDRPNPYTQEAEFLKYVQARDRGFARWLKDRRIDLDRLDDMSYRDRSATIRKVLPLLVFRDALIQFRKDGKPVRRPRHKTVEPFTGAVAVTRILEGNPRWIKITFSYMLDYYDSRTRTVSPGFQFDAITHLANRFESLLRVLPRPQGQGAVVSVPDLVNLIASHMSQENFGEFSADPVNCFTIDDQVPGDVLDALISGLYAGAFVHVRNRRSPAVLSDFRGERFRLAYLLGTRERLEFPLRLGKDVALSKIIAGRAGSRKLSDTQLRWEF